MAKSLAELQIGVRHLARESTIDLTTEANLEITNRTYRFLVTSLPWTEFRKVDISTSTTKGANTIGWPSEDNIFSNAVIVEIQDGDDNDRYKMISVPPDEWTWSEAAHKDAQSVPDHYVRYFRSSLQRETIEIRPYPKYDGKRIRVTGQTEPRDLESAGSKTEFLRKTADDVLEHMIASDFVSQAGDANWSQQLMNRAVLILQRTFGVEQVPEELLRQIVQQ